MPFDMRAPPAARVADRLRRGRPRSSRSPTPGSTPVESARRRDGLGAHRHARTGRPRRWQLRGRAAGRWRFRRPGPPSRSSRTRLDDAPRHRRRRAPGACRPADDPVGRNGHRDRGEAADGREAVEQSKRRRPDVVLMDIRMPVDGRPRGDPPDPGDAGRAPRVIVLTTFELDEYVYERPAHRRERISAKGRSRGAICSTPIRWRPPAARSSRAVSRNA